MLSQMIFKIGIVSLIIVLTIGGLAVFINEFKGSWERGDLGSLFLLTLIACLGMMLVGLLISLMGL